ncbi:MAG: NADH-quinone oxidoreductase subunit A [Myxococcus sp.]|nr:NADH-quinone oxidoreductase subunit A [Myxococcus sp.]
MSSGLALLAFLLVAVAVAGSMLVGARLLRVVSTKREPLKGQTYECGEVPSGVAWVRFHARYYVVALFFVLFDIETAFLLPWATIVREAGARGLVAVTSFVVVLMLGWAWATRKGALQWQ